MRFSTLSKQVGLALASAVVLTGCVLSTDAMVAEPDAIFEPALLGSWQLLDDSEHARISRRGEREYAIEYSDREDTVRLAGRLGRLEGRLVLDVWPTPAASDPSGPYDALMIPGHMLLVLDLGKDEIRMTALRSDSLLAALEAGKVTLPYTPEEHRVIVSAPADRLRAVLGAWMGRPEALIEPEVWRRGEAAAPAAP
jgi:hypothetical protein